MGVYLQCVCVVDVHQARARGQIHACGCRDVHTPIYLSISYVPTRVSMLFMNNHFIYFKFFGHFLC